MKNRKKLTGLIAALLIALCTWGYDHFVSGQNATAPLVQNATTTAIDPAKVWSRGREGRGAANAAEHFKKHGAEFGFKTEAEYVAAAVAFTSNMSKDVMQNRQRDGDTAFYNPKTAEYAVKTKNGYIRTYFKLDPKIHGYQSNTDYFNAQAKKQTPPANDNQKR